MKVAPTADYPVQVLRQEWEEPPDAAAWYAGIFTVTLNYHVDVAFVPDVSAVAPPWDDHLLPADVDEIETAQQARVATVLFSPYVVTPNEARAGGDETFRWPPDGSDAAQVVYYVTGEEFARYAANLDQLTVIAGGKASEPRVSELRDHPVVGFLERRVVASARLDPRHALLLGRTV
jgi:hypothetical protein